MADYLFRGSLEEQDPAIFELTELEAERQFRRLILIPSESTSPAAVREALGSSFHNIYAEGYPDEFSRRMTEDELLNYGKRLGHYRRYSDPRYYKGVEYADILEALARRRCAETFAANGLSADDLYVNVQALSGGPANNAVYHALVNPGDTVMGMNLLHGGHLSHGSPVNRSGKYYNIVHYTVDQETERLDYDQIETLAREHNPKMIIGGFSSYSWQADWKRMREIADAVGAYLMADIAHVAGLVAAGVYPSPIGHAHVITSTTHKTLCGPRGAIIITDDKGLAKKIDRAVFPGEQGGPHVNVFAALALTFKLAQTEQFKNLQEQIVKNCAVFTERFKERGFRIPFGGTDTHLTNLDTTSIKNQDGVGLSGDMAARILDLAGIVVNRNTIPGDRSALNPSGIRMGTPWITQRGFKEKKTIQLANIISDLLEASVPYRQKSTKRLNQRAKVDFHILEESKILVRELAVQAGIDYEPSFHDYPHFYYMDDIPLSKGEESCLKIEGKHVGQFLNYALTNDVENLIKRNDTQPTQIHLADKVVEGRLTFSSKFSYTLTLSSKEVSLVSSWLRNLSDGFIQFDNDIFRKLPGPITITEIRMDAPLSINSDPISNDKPFYIGIKNSNGDAFPEFEWEEEESAELSQTALHTAHKKLGAKFVPFAHWDMPIWYTSVKDEHRAVRENAGIFDVTHMGIFQAAGRHANLFLDSVCGNDIGRLKVGRSVYTHFLDPDGNVIDDLLVYRVAEEDYLLVVNASNTQKDWAWLQGVKSGKIMIDRERPSAKAFGRDSKLLNLHDSKEGKKQLVVVALQGPKSRDILTALGRNDIETEKVIHLKRNRLMKTNLNGIDTIVSRTGYTGETIGYELFVHPDQVEELWGNLLGAGKSHGIKACGLGARDSLRAEAGLPLYGNEIGGELGLGAGEAGFRSFVKTYKPWFIGRDEFLKNEIHRKSQVIRFRFNEKRVRVAHLGDTVVDQDGKLIGVVTSCVLDRKGTLTGQAFIENKYRKINTPIYIYQNSAKNSGKSPAELKPGDKGSIPTPASVIKRFPIFK